MNKDRQMTHRLNVHSFEKCFVKRNIIFLKTVLHISFLPNKWVHLRGTVYYVCISQQAMNMSRPNNYVNSTTRET